MNVTETTTKSWFSRLGGGISGFFIGLIVILFSVVILFLNEGWSVTTYRALAEGSNLVQAADSGVVDPANEGKLIHISGPVTVTETPTDNVFGIAAKGAVALTRNVETYQWVEDSKSETKTKVGGGEETVTTYSYSREWRREHVDSSKFKQPEGHYNPEPILEDSTYIVANAQVGAFQIAGKKLAALGDAVPLGITAAQTELFRQEIATDRPVQANAGIIYVGESGSSPQIGDMKISYSRTDVSRASIVAAQRGTMLADYQTSNGERIFLTASGDQSAADMFATAQTENTIFTWLIRFGGLLGVYAGFVMTFSILGIIGDVIPFVGSLVRFGTSIVAFLLTLVIGPTVIAIAWFAYRPHLSIGILCGAAIIFAAVFFLRRAKVAAQPTPAASS